MISIAAAAAITMGTMGTAHAVPDSDTDVDILTMVGSDTTQYFDEQFCADINANSYGDNPRPAGGGRVADQCFNIFAFADSEANDTEAVPTDTESGVTVPACTWYSPVPPETAGDDPTPASGCPASGDENAPTGSSAGRDRLLAAGNGTTVAQRSMVDIGRTSSENCSTTDLICYAYARDAMGWAHFKANNFSITLDQLRSIYDCTVDEDDPSSPDADAVDEWADLNIANAPGGAIELYYPQNGSGSNAFFDSVLGFDPLGNVATCPGGVSVPEQNEIRENNGDALAAAVSANGDTLANVIFPYSAAVWIAQKVDQPGFEVPNDTNTTKIGAIGGINPIQNQATATPTPNPAAYGEGSAYPAARYVYHSVDPGTQQQGAATHFVGTTTTGTNQRSVLCNNAAGSAGGNLVRNRIRQYGFQPLPVRSGTDPAHWGTCRVVL